MSALVFLDCETTSLSPFAYVWEFAGIRVDSATGTRVEKHLFLGDLDLTHADPAALRIGQFYERHPDAMAFTPTGENPKPRAMAHSSRTAAREIARLCQGATVVGSNPSFDTERLGRLLRRHGIAPTWNYRPIDVHTLMAAHLALTDPTCTSLANWADTKTDQMAEWLEVEPAGHARHTALGDAQWCERIWNRIASITEGGEE